MTLIICINLLRSRYYASRRIGHRNGQPDWPPSPGRLYAAMVAAFYTMHRNGLNPNRQAMEWLARQPNPEIYCSMDDDVRCCQSPPIYVPLPLPKLDLEKSFQKREKVFFWAVPKSPRIYYSWKTNDDGPIEALADILAHVTRLGCSSSWCEAYLVESFPSNGLAHLSPDPSGDMRMTIIYPEQMLELDERFELSRSVSVQSPLFFGNYSKAKEPENFHTWRAVGVRRPTYYDIGTFIEAVRQAICDICERTNIKPDAIMGHLSEQKDQRLKLLPLLVAHQYCDFALGLGVAIPRSIPPEERRQCLAVLGQLNSAGDPNAAGFYSWKLERIHSDDKASKTLRPRTWCKESKVWATVTPMEFRWGATDNQETVFKLCEQLGFQATEVEIDHFAFLPGIPPARDFQSRSIAKSRPYGFRQHVKITFKHSIPGPLALGRGANFGSGFFKPCERRRGNELPEAARIQQHDMG